MKVSIECATDTIGGLGELQDLGILCSRQIDFADMFCVVAGLPENRGSAEGQTLIQQELDHRFRPI
jgi:hypothetical protein